MLVTIILTLTSILLSGADQQVALSTLHSGKTIDANNRLIPYGNGLYSVTFTPTGLPVGDTWSVTFHGQTKSATPHYLNFNGHTFFVPALITFNTIWGNYSFSVTPPSGYSANQTSGLLYVDSNMTVPIAILKCHCVTFTQTTLLPHVEWGVTLYPYGQDNGVYKSADGPITFCNVSNGAYTYIAQCYHHPRQYWGGGNFTMSGDDLNINVTLNLNGIINSHTNENS